MARISHWKNLWQRMIGYLTAQTPIVSHLLIYSPATTFVTLTSSTPSLPSSNCMSIWTWLIFWTPIAWDLAGTPTSWYELWSFRGHYRSNVEQITCTRNSLHWHLTDLIAWSVGSEQSSLAITLSSQPGKRCFPTGSCLSQSCCKIQRGTTRRT